MTETLEQRRTRFGNYGNGHYILCNVSDDGTRIAPQGHGKCFTYANELLKEYRAHGEKGWQLFKLKKVRCFDGM